MMPVGCPFGASASAGALAGRHERDELVVADLDERVARRDLDGLPVLALRPDAHDLAERLLLHAGEERLDDAELDVGLEQREAHLAERRLDVLLGELGEPGEAVSRGLKPLASASNMGGGLAHVGAAVTLRAPE